MPTVIFKLLALSGVITAGCFAVWKANTELQPKVAADPTEFSALEGDRDEGAGLGGQPITKSDASIATDEMDEEPVSEADKSLALASHEFADESVEEETATPRGMPAAFPPEQDEPTVAEAPEVSEPDPGVLSLEALEEAENAKPEGRVRTSGETAAKAPTLAPGPLRRVPADAGSPALMTIPGSKAATTTAPKTAVRDPAPGRVVPANAENFADDSLELTSDTSDGPALPGEISTPEEVPELDSAAEDSQYGMPEARTRSSMPSSIPAADTGAATEPEQDSNPFLNTTPDPSGDSSIPDSLDTEPSSSIPSPFAPRTRSTVPTPIDQETDQEAPADADSEPAQLNISPNHKTIRTPTNTHAVGESIDSSTVPKSSIPTHPTIHKSITEEMRIGNATVDDPLITPTQQPQLRIEKKAQAEAEVGEKFIYEIIVQNIGQVAAQHVVVEERIPKGCRMERSQPQARMGRDRILRWELETMQPNTEQVIKVEVTPLEAGPVGSVATVRFAAQVATRTVVTAPTLSLSIKHAQEVAVGDEVPVKFIVTNTGTGVARKATLRAMLQEGLTHPAGLDLDRELGTIAPGESKEIDLVLTAAEKGRFTPTVVVTANGIEQENRTLDLSVIESRLTLQREGHVRRFVNRPAEFVTTVTNHSVEVMKDVVIIEQLPAGVTPVGEMSKFRWDPKERTVKWKVSELGPGQHSDLKLTVVSEKAGNLTGKVEAVAASGHKAELPTALEVQGFSNLTLDFQGDGKAVAVGDQVSMRVTVGNRGSAPAKQVQAQFELPPQMTFVDAKGPGTFTQEGNLVTFAAVEEIAPDTNRTYDIVLVAAEQGNPSVAVDLISAESPDPVRQEEPVRITP